MVSHLQAGDAASGVVAHLLGAPSVDDHRHVVNGDGCLRHVCGHHDLRTKDLSTSVSPREERKSCLAREKVVKWCQTAQCHHCCRNPATECKPDIASAVESQRHNSDFHTAQISTLRTPGGGRSKTRCCCAGGRPPCSGSSRSPPPARSVSRCDFCSARICVSR